MCCPRCGQLPRAVLPGPGHCTCPRDRDAAARRRVAAAHAALCAGRAAVLKPSDLYHVEPDLVAELLTHERLTITTTTLLYYRAETFPRVLSFWTRSGSEAGSRE